MSYPRRRITGFDTETYLYGADSANPHSLKVDGGVTNGIILGGADNDLANFGYDVSQFKTIRGSVRSNKAVTLTVHQSHVTVSGAVVWLETETPLTLVANTAADFGPFDLKSGRIKITATNAGTPTTDLATIHLSLYLHKD